MGKCILAGHPPVGGQIGYGTYTGDGAASRTISLGITPKWVLVVAQTGQMGDVSGTNVSYCGGLALQDSPVLINNNNVTPVVKIQENGFCVYYVSGERQAISNLRNQLYNYIYGT